VVARARRSYCRYGMPSELLPEKSFQAQPRECDLSFAYDIVYNLVAGRLVSTSGCTNMSSWQEIASGLSPDSRVKSCTICI
jgi:hypothetical protein